MKTSILIQISCLLISISSFAQEFGGTKNLDPRIIKNTNGPIYDYLIQEEGTVLVVGKFDSYQGFSRNNINRLNPDGTLDNTFLQNAAANNTVNSVLRQEDGTIVVLGLFTEWDGESRNYLAKLHHDGSVDLDFVPDITAEEIPTCIELQLDGKILVYSKFAKNGAAIKRLNKDGSIDRSFKFSDSIISQLYSEDLSMQKNEDIFSTSACEILRNLQSLSSNTSFICYPNPSYGLVYLKFEGDLSTNHITILDLNGVILRQYKLENKEISELDISNLHSGIYVLKVANHFMNQSTMLVKR